MRTFVRAGAYAPGRKNNMSTIAIRPVRLSRRRIMRPQHQPSRVAVMLRFIRDVFVEARAMAMEARRRYPHAE